MGLTVTIRARVTPELNAAVQAKAFELHLKKSDLIRFALATICEEPKMEASDAIDLDDMDLANIDSIKEAKRFAAMSDAIRHALNVTGRICRREMLEDKIELEALRRVMD